MRDEAEEIAAVLADSSGRTASEVRDALRKLGRVSITTADVTRGLTGHPRRFHHDGQHPARWWAGTAAVAGRPDAYEPGPTALPTLYRWQTAALEAWRAQGRRGVVEAVTGTGKTVVGVAAALAELGEGGQVCVLVPTKDLQAQWNDVLSRCLPPRFSVGLLGDGRRDGLGNHDVLVAIVNSARGADLRPRRPGGLLIADECHRYASDNNRLALEVAFPRRLGLSATFARADEGHLDWLAPYFGVTCYRMGYAAARADGVMARFSVALVGVAFSIGERGEYDELTLLMSAARSMLIAKGAVPAEPVGRFFEAVARLARQDGDDAALARSYLAAMQNRRRLMAETPAKIDLLRYLTTTVQAADRAIVFTQTLDGAKRSASALRDGGVAAAAMHSGLSSEERHRTLRRFAEGRLHAVAAPLVLDEGVDVPAADLAIILAASRSRRQMVQRMGRVLRKKADGRLARFVVVFVEGTVEDPASGAHEGFLDEITGVAEAVRTFRPHISESASESPSGSEAASLLALRDFVGDLGLGPTTGPPKGCSDRA